MAKNYSGFNHLKDIDQTYYEHFKDSMFYFTKSLKSAFFFFIHGIYPDIFVKNGSDNVIELHEIIIQKYNEINIRNNNNNNNNNII